MSATIGSIAAQEQRPPWTVKVGNVQFRPAGFLDVIETTRSATMVDSVNTPLGSVPLSDTPAQTLASARHSRLMLTSTSDVGKFQFRTYLESDFMNTAPGQSPYRWRQYWGQVRFGKWELLGGQAWSLLRPNRRGIASDADMMNTDVVEPAYHVGLLGARRRQIRLTRSFGNNFTVAIAWEGTGNTVAKIVQDRRRLHWELQALSGIHGHRGAGVAAVYSVMPRVRLITQDFWSRHAISEALGVVPRGVNGVSMIQGVEVQARRTLEIYAYGGVVRAARSAETANRMVGEWSVGLNQFLNGTFDRTRLRFSLEFSHLDRATWANRTGQMNYVMALVRYSFN
ncbi:MAG: hypothetical protein IT168_15335 [Bryobacterales bacterium]|nr:hypothetical protein [Bryobacterales bacterium]